LTIILEVDLELFFLSFSPYYSSTNFEKIFNANVSSAIPDLTRNIKLYQLTSLTDLELKKVWLFSKEWLFCQ
jgi:hypothetical protein